jgi:hypothetical protein
MRIGRCTWCPVRSSARLLGHKGTGWKAKKKRKDREERLDILYRHGAFGRAGSRRGPTIDTSPLGGRGGGIFSRLIQLEFT